MGLIGIGPVELGPRDHGNPTYSWGANASSRSRQATIGGLMPWVKADQILQLVESSDRQTIAGTTGILEYIEFSGDLLSPKSGDYLILDFSTDPNKAHTMDPDGAPFSLSLAGPLPS